MTKLDWSARRRLEEQHVVFEKRPHARGPRVTVGMPTYRRAHTLRRALASVAQQTYRDFVLVVSDNGGEDPESLRAIRDVADALPGVVLVAQRENLGALGNLHFLLTVADTEYFMWLADDDEISPNYLEELVAILDEDRSVVTAMGQWMAMQSPTEGSARAQLRPDERDRLLRLIHFVAGRADDSAFYGLHRTDCVRRVRFDGYMPPNRGVLTNWCYVMLFDMLLQGRIAFSDKATWICHNYSEKNYDRALARGLSDKLKTLARRLNVYCIYMGKTARRAPLLTPAIAAASVAGFSRDVATALARASSSALARRLTAVRGTAQR